MPGVGWAAYQGEDPAFYTEQTILEAKAQERIKQAERDGIDLFEGHEEDVVTAGDCLYGVGRGANAVATLEVCSNTKHPVAAAAAAAYAPARIRTAKDATLGAPPRPARGARAFSNTFDRHRTMIVLANRELQAKKAGVKAQEEAPRAHDTRASSLRAAILSGDVDALPASHGGTAPPPSLLPPPGHAKQARPRDVDTGGRPVKPRAGHLDAGDVDAEMAALVEGAVDAAKERNTTEAATKAVAAATTKTKKPMASPAWAMTASKADEIEAAEEEALLAFADNLDFNGYVEAIDAEDLDEAKSALDALVAAAAEDEGDFGHDPSVAGASGASASAQHLARVDAWKGKFIEAINRVRECEDKMSARRTAIRSARAAVALAGTTGAGAAAGASADAFLLDGGAGAVSAKEKAADAEARRLLDNFPELAKVHSARSLKGVLERTAKPPTPGPSRPGTAESSGSFGSFGEGDRGGSIGAAAKADALAAALATVEE